MPDNKFIGDYKQFMHWFAKKYPALFKEYASNIVKALDETGLKIRVGKLDQETYDVLSGIQNEFYSQPRLGI